MPSKINEFVAAQIMHRYALGEPLSYIANTFGVSRQTVRKVLNTKGITTKDQVALQAVKLLTKYNLSVKKLEKILKNYHAQYQD